jgi:Co/Zn/Cd efflux system component
MKKILSLVVFFALLVWTWNVIHTSPAIGFETHSAIQDKIVDLLTSTLQAKRPQAQNIEVIRLWTENLDENKIRAVFAYKFQDKIAASDSPEQSSTQSATQDNTQSTDQTIEGEAILQRQSSDDPSLDNWKLLEVKTTGDTVIFREGSTITPDESSQ